MPKMDERGVSLVEVLAALLLVSIISAAAWTALTIGMKHTTAETSKTEIQQDANIIITKLSAVHRQNDRYSLKIANKQLMLSVFDGSSWSPAVPVLEKDYDFTGTKIDGTPLSSEREIEPKRKHAQIDLFLEKNGRSLNIQTTLTRIRTDRP